MPSWKKVITSGSDAAFRSVTASAGFTGSFSGSFVGTTTAADTLLTTVASSWTPGVTASLLFALGTTTGYRSISFQPQGQLRYQSTGINTGVLLATSSWAQSASYALTASYAPTVIPYKSYVALYTCTTDNNPTPTVIEDTLGATITWENTTNTEIKVKVQGTTFSTAKTYFIATAIGSDGTPRITATTNQLSSIAIYPYDLSGNLDFNIGDAGARNYGTLEIRVYP